MVNRKRPVLREGETVGVVAPGFAVRRDALRRGLAALEAEGFRVRLGEHVRDRAGYLAGADADRAADLASMIVDPEVRAIWFARGGFGSSRLLDRLPWEAYAADPKPLLGYSDLTAIFAHALKHDGAACLYGPVVTELGEPSLYHRDSLRAALDGRPISLGFSARQVVSPGRAAGRLAGGNLTLLAHLCGTPWAPRLGGRVLFVEEVGEEVYRLDRLLLQLRLSGALRGVRAVLLGHFAAPARRRFPPSRRLGDVLFEFFGELGIPVIRGIRAGHCRAKRTLPLGWRTEIDTAARTLVFRP